MIEFQLQVDARLLQSLLPEIEKTFAQSYKNKRQTFQCPILDDEDLVDAWEKGLSDDSLDDRLALAKIFKSPKFKYGYVELEESDADGALRSLTELRLSLRENALSEVKDSELETGNLSLNRRESSVKVAYFTYLILAEIQESLIATE
ncbi:MAG: hypothetical protein ACJZ7A_08085 [Opitutales bacterium]